MVTLTLIALFIFGTILGSGLNALAYRMETGRPWIRGRSRCPHCGHRLGWWELIPVVSFLLLGRRCHQCQKAISWQYPLVELAAGGLLSLSYLTFGVTLATVLAALTSLILLFIYIYDGRTMLIPDPAVWAFNILAVGSLFLNLNHSLVDPSSILFVIPGWWAIVAGPLVASPFLLIWLVTGGRAMGFGDVKLALGIGWLLGIGGGLSAAVFAFWIGAAVSLALLAYQRLWKSPSPKETEGHTIKATNRADINSSTELTMKSAVPLGPFLILGWLIVFFSDITLF